MPLTAAQQAALSAAIDRLQNYYDGDNPYNPATNPGGFRQGGQVVNFEPALKDTATVMNLASILVADATAAATSSPKALRVDSAQSFSDAEVAQAISNLRKILRADGPNSFSLAEQLQGRQNLGVRGSGIIAKSAAYTVAASDAGKLIAASGTWPLTLPAAGSVPGLAIEISNAGVGKITLTPNGSETISGLSTLVVNRGEAGALVSDGTNWQAIGFSPVVVSSSVASGAGYIRWSNGFCVQWGTVGSGNDAAVNFPLAYSIAPAVVATVIGASTATGILEAVGISALGNGSFAGRPRYVGSGGVSVSGDVWNWVAFGWI